jgi:hypothetical protein
MFSQQIIQSSFQGLGAFGDTPGQALRGSIVDAVLQINFANRVVGYTATLTRALVDRLNSSGFHVINLDDSNLNMVTGGSIRARVQVLSDGFSSAQDAASVVAGAASALGYNVVGFSGSLVLSAAQGNVSGTTQSGQTFDPFTVPDTTAPSAAGSISDFIGSLTKSPVTLAVVLGAAVILVIAAKK